MFTLSKDQRDINGKLGGKCEILRDQGDMYLLMRPLHSIGILAHVAVYSSILSYYVLR